MILEIAIGIVLAVVFLRLLPEMLTLAGSLVLLVLILAGLTLLFGDLSKVLSIVAILAGARLLLWAAENGIRKERRRGNGVPPSTTDPQEAGGAPYQSPIAKANEQEIQRIRKNANER